jgi:hypothetical protein
MSDWELVDFSNAPKIQENMSEWELYTPPEEKEKEALLLSLGMAPFRIGTDITKSAYGAIQNIPQYMKSAKTEFPGIAQTMTQHPGHMGMQALAGANEAINKMAQLPLNLSQYGEQRLNLVPHGMTNAISKITPNDTSGAIEQLFGSPKYPGESLIRGSFRNLPEITALGKAGSMAKSLTNKSIVNDVLNTKEMLQNKYSGPQGLYTDLFDKATQAGARPDLNIDSNKIKYKNIGASRIKNNFPAIEKLQSGNKLTLPEYQQAIKDFGTIERNLDETKLKKGELNSSQDKRYHAAKNAKKYIQENMFKDNQGNLISDYLPRHKTIQEGYAKEVIPYTTNKSISLFENGKIKEADLIASLRKNPFSAQRGGHHKLETRDKLLRAAISAGILGGGSAAYEYGWPIAQDFIKYKSEQNK